MKKLVGIAAVAVTCTTPVIVPAAAPAQSGLPSVPGVPALPPAPPPPPALPGVPDLPPPPGSGVDPATGVVTAATGEVLGVLDPLTGLVLPGSASGGSDAGSGGSTTSGGSGSGAGGSSTSTPTTPPRPTGADATGAAGSSSDRAAPTLTLRVVRTTSAATARRRGVKVTARCSEICRVTLRLTKDGQYGSLSTALKAGRTTTLHLRLNRGAKGIIAVSRKRSKLLLRGQAIDQAGNRGAILRRTAYVQAARR
jgi:hypothetical protein